MPNTKYFESLKGKWLNLPPYYRQPEFFLGHGGSLSFAATLN